MEMIKIKNLSKAFNEKSVFNSFNLDIENNKITAILGESGTGKTTLLNCIAGLIDYEGEILGAQVSKSYVFQTDRLIKNLTVKQNLQLICPDINAEEELKDFGLTEALYAYPHELSAGMKRRVAIIRGINFPSELLLMDEPFVNLDLALKHRIIQIVKKKINSLKKTAIFVTHDIKEATLLADRIILLKGGEIACDITSVDENAEEQLYNRILG